MAKYYIVKPKTKQKFYLGDIKSLLGIPSAYTNEPEYCKYESYIDVLNDLMVFYPQFNEYKYTLGQITDFAHKVYEFCNDKVLLVCDIENTEYANWEEIDVFSDIPTDGEMWANLINLIPMNDWVTKNNVLQEYETVKRYLEKVQREVIK